MGSVLSPMNSNPLISIFVSFHVLILLYAPHLFLPLLLSPVLICTGVLLAGILHLGTSKKQKQLESPKPSVEVEDRRGEKEEERETDVIFGPERPSIEVEDRRCEKEEERETEVVFRPERRFSDIFVEWNRRAPLEVIYEDYEGEQEEEAGDLLEHSPPARRREETCSLSLCYPDSDSDTSSNDSFLAMEEWERPENRCFRWEEEKDDGLIEIPIFLGMDTCRNEGRGAGLFPVDEDNLIEIDLFHQTVVKRPRFSARIQAAT